MREAALKLAYDFNRYEKGTDDLVYVLQNLEKKQSGQVSQQCKLEFNLEEGKVNFGCQEFGTWSYTPCPVVPLKSLLEIVIAKARNL